MHRPGTTAVLDDQAGFEAESVQVVAVTSPPGQEPRGAPIPVTMAACQAAAYSRARMTRTCSSPSLRRTWSAQRSCAGAARRGWRASPGHSSGVSPGESGAASYSFAARSCRGSGRADAQGRTR